MKSYLLLSLSLAVLFSGCSDRAAEARREREAAESKARAEAARKEMDALPKAFRPRDYFKKNEPEQPAPQTPPQ